MPPGASRWTASVVSITSRATRSRVRSTRPLVTYVTRLDCPEQVRPEVSTETTTPGGSEVSVTARVEIFTSPEQRTPSAAAPDAAPAAGESAPATGATRLETADCAEAWGTARRSPASAGPSSGDADLEAARVLMVRSISFEGSGRRLLLREG